MLSCGQSRGMQIIKEFPKQLINDHTGLKNKKWQDHGYPWEGKRTETPLSSPLFSSPERGLRGDEQKASLLSPIPQFHHFLVPCLPCWAYFCRMKKKQTNQPCHYQDAFFFLFFFLFFFFLALVGFYWHKSTKIKIFTNHLFWTL